MAKWLTDEISNLLDSNLSEQAQKVNTSISFDEIEHSDILWEEISETPSRFAEYFLSNPDDPSKSFHCIPPQAEILDSQYKFNTLRMR